MNDFITLGEILIKRAGSASSGNFGHGGRQGKVGGSVSRSMAAIADYKLADLTGAQLAEQQRLVSIANAQRLLDEYDSGKLPTEMRRDQLEHWVDRLEEHRSLILEEALHAQKEGLVSLSPAERKDLERRLIYHDMDKYRMDVAEPYVMGGLFSREKPKDDTYIEASKAAVRKHHEVNDHHPRYWNKREVIDNKVTYRPTPMSDVAVAEMIGDLRGTSREKGTDVNQWYAKHRESVDVHPQTRRILDRAFSYTAPPASKRDQGETQQAKPQRMSDIMNAAPPPKAAASAKPVANQQANRKPPQKRAGPITKYRIPANGEDIEFDFDAKPQKRRKETYTLLTNNLIRSRG